MSVPRMVTVWCADWPVVAAGAAADVPAAVLVANRVVARTPAAAVAGVQRGARRRAAQGACPELQLHELDRDRDGRAFEPVVRAVAELAPRLEVGEPGWLTLLARGPSRYFGGDQALAERLHPLVVAATGSVGFGVGVGIADGRSASSIAARRAARTSSGVIVVPPGGSPDFVSPLSVGWLGELGEIDPELVDLFARLGLRTCGQLAALDGRDVLARFGVVGQHAHRLANGLDTRLPAAADPPPEWCVEHPFPEPVEQLETVVFVGKRLADKLVATLSGDGRVCTRLVVVVETEHGERNERVWYRHSGLSAAAMVERIRWQLEGWVAQPGGLSGGVALVRLVPDEVRSDDGVQGGFWGGRSRADHDAARAIVRLSGMIGDDGARVPEWTGGRLPADRFRWVPAATVDLDDRDDGGADRRPWPGALPPPSPMVVPPVPVPAELHDRAGQPVMVSGRGEVTAAPAVLIVAGSRQRVTGWAGPWPVEERWWSTGRSRRMARFQVVTEQGAAHLIGVEQQRWSVLATYS